MTRVCAFVAAVGALLLPAYASADRVYHSEHLPLVSADGAHHGFVQNIHPNGPKVYAHEIYSLKGALPNTTYQVFLLVHLEDSDCRPPGEAVSFGYTALTTNAVGNGTADRFIESVLPGIRNQTHGVRWEVRTPPPNASTPGTVVYQTACTSVTLD